MRSWVLNHELLGCSGTFGTETGRPTNKDQQKANDFCCIDVSVQNVGGTKAPIRPISQSENQARNHIFLEAPLFFLLCIQQKAGSL